MTITIANEVGCDEGVIRRILDPKASQATTWMSFDKADRILCKLGLPMLWHTEPALVEVYEYLDNYDEYQRTMKRESWRRQREKANRKRLDAIMKREAKLEYMRQYRLRKKAEAAA